MLATSKVNQTGEQPKPASLSAREPAPTGLILFMGAVMLLQLAGKSVTDTFFTVYLDVSLHLSPAWLGALSAVAQLLIIPIALSAPLLLLHWGKRGTIIGGTLGMAVSMLLLALFLH